MKLIERSKYLAQIEYWLGKELIVVLTGQRRVGKSMCLRLLANRMTTDENNVIYIDKEDYQYSTIIEATTLNAYDLIRIKRQQEASYHVFRYNT